MGQQGTKVVSRDGAHTGKTTGATMRCTMAGCTGLRIVVRWEDGKTTRPCSKGLENAPDGSLRLV